MVRARLVHASWMRSTSASIFQPKVLITKGCISSSRVAFFQSILGSNAASQGYPKTISSSPRSVMRNLISLDRSPHLTRRSTKCVMWPDLLCVPSIFHMVRGLGRFSFPIFIRFRSLLLIKLSVTPESTRTCLSALECVLCNSVGILNDLYLHVYTLLIPKMRAQAAGGILTKNPPRSPAPPSFLSRPLWPFGGCGVGPLSSASWPFSRSCPRLCPTPLFRCLTHQHHCCMH
jgi:hypothetical protein